MRNRGLHLVSITGSRRVYDSEGTTLSICRKRPIWVLREVTQQTIGQQNEESAMNLVIRPLTPDQWPALEDLFGEHGAVNGCWCMYWRIGSAFWFLELRNVIVSFDKSCINS